MKIQLSVTPEQGRMLVQILAESRDNFCDDRREYYLGTDPEGTGDNFNEELRDKTYDDYGNLLKVVSEQVDVESNP